MALKDAWSSVRVAVKYRISFEPSEASIKSYADVIETMHKIVIYKFLYPPKTDKDSPI